MQRYFDVVQNRQGTAVVGATVTVYDANGNLATLYSNNSGAASSNPVYTNSDGEYAFYAANGTYSITIAQAGYATETKPGVVLFDPSDSGASNNVQFLQAGTGAQVRSVQSKLRDVVSVKDFGAVGAAIGSTPPDETAALTAFFNSAIANPGIPHRLDQRAYGISSPLPTINCSGVIIQGSGQSFLNNVGSLFSSTTIVWVGAASASTMITMQPDVNPSTGQVLSAVTLFGIAFDCRAVIATGVAVRSVRSSLLGFAVANATTTGVILGTLASSSLGENEDLQTNDIYLSIRQIDGAGVSGLPLRLQGSSTANVSLNRFRMVEIQHANTSAVIEENADNNIWEEFRSFCAGSGSYSVEWLGGAVEAQSCRAENFYKFSANKPAVGRGTGTYAYPATNNLIFSLDLDNSTPAPVYETSATGVWWDTRGVFGGSNGGVTAIGGAFGEAVGAALSARARLGATGSVHVTNGSDDHIRLSNLDNSARWGINLTSGNLRTLRLAGSGYFLDDLSAIPDYANDAAAAAGGVPVGGRYRNGSVLQIRVT
jgi:hypothetical protein